MELAGKIHTFKLQALNNLVGEATHEQMNA
jgi:hypothetical protein